eukprot:Hpha_TRINITY_DN15011_c1_g4::TRINITY_DN15011_c1_g4_i2::g.126339::m.126339
MRGKDKELEVLREKVAGWQQHLRSHLVRKEEEMQRQGEQHTTEMKLLRLHLTEAETRARVLQHIMERDIAAAHESAQREADHAVEKDDQLRSLRRALEAALQSHDSERANVASAESQLTELRCMLAEAEGRQAAADGARQKAEAELRAINEELEQQRNSAVRLAEKLVEGEQASESVAEVQRMASVLERRASGAEEALEEEREQGSVLRGRLAQQVAELSAARDAAHSRSVRLQQELDELRLTMQLQARQRDAAQTAAKTHASEADEARSEISRTKGTLANVAQTLDHAEQSLHQRERALKDWEEKYAEKVAEVEAMRALLQKSSEVIDRVQNASADREGEVVEELARLTARATALEAGKRQADISSAEAQAEADEMKRRLEAVDVLQEETRKTIVRLQEMASLEKEGREAAEERERRLAGALAETSLEKDRYYSDLEKVKVCAEGLRRELASWAARGEEWLLRETTLNGQLAAARDEATRVGAELAVLERGRVCASSEHRSRMRELEDSLESAMEEKSRRASISIRDTISTEGQWRNFLEGVESSDRDSLRHSLRSSRAEVVASDASSRLQAAEATLEATQTELSEAKRRVASLGDELESSLRAQREYQGTKEEEGGRLQNEIETLRMYVRDKETALADAEAAARRADQTRAKLEDMAARREALLVELGAQMESKSADLGNLGEALAAHVKQSQSLKDSLAEKERELGVITQAEQKSARKAAEESTERRRLEQTLAEERATADAVHEKQAGLFASTRALSARNESLSRDLERNEQALTALRSELEAKSMAIQSVSTDAARSAAQVEELQTELLQKTRKIAELEEGYAERREEWTNALDNSTAAAQRQREAAAASAAEEQRLRDRLQESNEQTVRAEGTAQALSDKVAEQSAVIRRAEGRIEILEREVVEVRQREDVSLQKAAEVSQLLARNEDCSRALEALKGELLVREQMIGQLHEALAKAQRQVVPAEARTLQEQAVQKLAEEASTLRSTLAQRTQELAAAKHTLKTQDGDLVELAGALQEEALRVAKLNQCITEQHSSLTDEAAGRKRAEMRLIDLHSNSSTLADSYRQLESRFCSPYITPMSEGWDSEEAAAFIRQVKQWVINYSSMARAVPSDFPTHSPRRMQVPIVSPTRSFHLAERFGRSGSGSAGATVPGLTAAPQAAAGAEGGGSGAATGGAPRRRSGEAGSRESPAAGKKAAPRAGTTVRAPGTPAATPASRIGGAATGTPGSRATGPRTGSRATGTPAATPAPAAAAGARTRQQAPTRRFQ